MSASNKPLPAWYYYFINSAPADILSRGFQYDTPKRKSNSKSFWDIETTSRLVRGTGIQVRTIKRYLAGGRPSQKNLKILKNSYRRYSYHRMRINGASTQQANRSVSMNPEITAHNIEVYEDTLKRFLQAKNINVMDAIWAMQQSRKMITEDWEEYVFVED